MGDISIQLYGGRNNQDSGGTFIEYNGGNFTRALAQTEKLMSSMFRTPIFEATLQHGGVPVRQDVLLPDDNSWRIVEVKASTRVKRAREAVMEPMPDVPVGQHCTSPYECPFLGFCWPSDSDYPIRGLGGSKKKTGGMGGCQLSRYSRCTRTRNQQRTDEYIVVSVSAGPR